MCVCVFLVSMNWVWSNARSDQVCKFVFSYRPFRALDMLMFMIILHDRMNIKHFQNVFNHKIFFLVKLILRLQFKETILGEQNMLARNLLGALSSLLPASLFSILLLSSFSPSFLSSPLFSSSLPFIPLSFCSPHWLPPSPPSFPSFVSSQIWKYHYIICYLLKKYNTFPPCLLYSFPHWNTYNESRH